MRALLGWVAAGLALSASSCAVGEGSGEAHSDLLKVPGCYEGAYDLGPTFFFDNPYRSTQTIRLQRRDDLVENSDGLQVMVRDTDRVRAHLGESFKVGLPPEVTPPGVPIVPDPDPPVVNLTLYLHDTCHGQNVALYATTGTITFAHLFSGDTNERDADDKLSEATFDVMMGDPRDQPPEGGPIPPEKMSHLTGNFSFYFERGQPAQPFP